MTIVYQVRSLYIAKDMIFGWCIARDAAVYNPITNLSHDDIKVLLGIEYPAIIPEDFVNCLHRLLSKFELEAAISSAKLELKTMQEKVRNLEVGLIRSRDRVSLVSQIMEKMVFEIGGVWTSDLGYVKLVGMDDQWLLIQRGRMLDNHTHLPVTFDDVVDVILRRWW